ncbi:baseplate assembly protein V [Haloarcula tailed virus 2]|uniref:Baseplate assembly protein V n=1 Tax=Haloarcula tailed virus 2 TaxID=2877989 RepID=A0AAE8XYR1_9CAUD|nr:baseplate assembly protein V [Haloarcula tailed virus 2]UBF23177.1 baseplate assembly protein V [Haloarcula tailed virus 2]
MRENSNKTQKASGFDIGEIVSVAPNARHLAVYRLRGQEGTEDVASVTVPARSDINIPTEGDIVLIGYARNGSAFIIGTVYSESDNTMGYERGYRRIGHTRSTSRFELQGDGTVRLFSYSGSELKLGPDGAITATTDDGATLQLKEDGNIEISDSTGASVRVEDGRVFLDNYQQLFVAEGTNTNINASNNISWNTTVVSDAPFSFDGTNVTFQEDGRYEIRCNADFASTVARTNPNIFIRDSGGAIQGVGGRSGYMRNASGHDHSSVHAEAVIVANSGDSIHAEGNQEAQAETIVPHRAQLIIKKL